LVTHTEEGIHDIRLLIGLGGEPQLSDVAAGEGVAPGYFENAATDNE